MSKGTKIILAIVVVVALILIFDPFGGSDIEGEWEVVSIEMDGKKEYLSDYDDVDMEEYTLVFRDDGTATAFGETVDYTYEEGELVLNGNVVECEIKGDTMTWTMREAWEEYKMTFERK